MCRELHFVSAESGVTEMPGLGWGADFKMFASTGSRSDYTAPEPAEKHLVLNTGCGLRICGSWVFPGCHVLGFIWPTEINGIRLASLERLLCMCNIKKMQEDAFETL